MHKLTVQVEDIDFEELERASKTFFGTPSLANQDERNVGGATFYTLLGRRLALLELLSSKEITETTKDS